MFTKATFEFLDELSANNNRTWFEANKPRYEALVREPALDFIEAMDPVLATFAPNFRAEPRKMGGSLMRVFRDTRFSRDKTPYKTNIGSSSVMRWARMFMRPVSMCISQRMNASSLSAAGIRSPMHWGNYAI
jgi:uncharacterized protein (TIGR02453 family)